MSQINSGVGQLNFFSLSVTEDELLMFDLQSLATLATARALEMGSEEGSSTGSGRHFPARRILNLRRKCSWTPRNEPVRLKILQGFNVFDLN